MRLDVSAWAKQLPTHYALSGTKSEPTVLLALDSWRDGDDFSITGGGPAWVERSTESVAVADDGTISHLVCPAGMDCTNSEPPAGFLAGASLLAALRRGADLGSASVLDFGGRQVVCVPAERLAIVDPILDPCFDRLTGAVLAQRHRLSGKFDGPSLDAWSVQFVDETAS